jgi:hypothetical protein
MECCDVCCEKLNKTKHKKVECPFCDLVTCRTCTQKYILSLSDDPHCMKCKNEHSREFIDTFCTVLFRTRDLKNHRENILFERERARMPETQVYVVRELEMRKIRVSYVYLAFMLSRVHGSIHVPEVAKDVLYDTLRENLATLYRDMRELTTNEPIVEIGQNMFTQKCPGEECRGFLSDDWKCGICKKVFCKKCHEEDVHGHVCDKDTVKTIKLLRKDTKQCPKCNVSITKIEGCAQMWCTQCHVAFDWRTGRIETGRIHNPHYFEFKKRTREHGDIPCGGCPTYNELRSNLAPQTLIEACIEVQRLDRDIAYRYGYLFEDNHYLRMQYLLNEISETNMKRELQRRDKYNCKVRDIRDIYRMYVDTVGDILRQFMLNSSKTDEYVNEIRELTKYTNTVIDRIRYRYTSRTPYHVYVH